MLGLCPGSRKAREAIAAGFRESEALAKQIDDGPIERSAAPALFALQRVRNVCRQIPVCQMACVHCMHYGHVPTARVNILGHEWTRIHTDKAGFVSLSV